jgi:hypothetical protein
MDNTCIYVPIIEIANHISHQDISHPPFPIAICIKKLRGRLLVRSVVDTTNHAVVTLERLKSDLVLGLDTILAHLLNFAGEDLGSGGSRVNTVGLDGNHDATTVLEEPVGIVGHNTGLIRLGNIGKDAVDHGNEETVAGGLTGILDDGNNVGALGGHGDEITARARRELDGVDEASRANKIRNVGDGRSGGTTEVKNPGAGLNVNVVDTSSNGGAQLASEGVPGAVLDLGGGCSSVLILLGLVGRDALLAVDGLARGHASSGEAIFLGATNDEDTGVLMGFLCRDELDI